MTRREELLGKERSTEEVKGKVIESKKKMHEAIMEFERITKKKKWKLLIILEMVKNNT